jgi:hypothetical protein
MRRKRDNIRLLPGDGWIELEPGEWVVFTDDAPISPSSIDLNAWMQRIRGGILAEAFSFENNLIQLDLTIKFPPHECENPTDDYLEEEQKLREEHSLKRKIERAKPIVRAHWEPVRAERLVQKLADCRIIRNLMAHYPSWLTPVNDEARRITVSLKLCIADRYHVWEIDEAQVREWSQLLLESQQELIALRMLILGKPVPVFAPGSTSVLQADTPRVS